MLDISGVTLETKL